jgi:hypothetical protein
MLPDIGAIPLTFEDRLRALGWFIDNRDIHSINLTIEQDDVTLKAQKGSGDEARPVEIHLTAQEMAVICRDARRRSGNGVYRPAASRPSRLNALRQRQTNNVPLSQWVDQTQVLSYQELLRAIGFDLDRWKAVGFRLEEYGSGLLLRVQTAAGGSAVQQVYPLSKEELRIRIAQSLRRRGHRRPISLGAASAAS